MTVLSTRTVSTGTYFTPRHEHIADASNMMAGSKYVPMFLCLNLSNMVAGIKYVPMFLCLTLMPEKFPGSTSPCRRPRESMPRRLPSPVR